MPPTPTVGRSRTFSIVLIGIIAAVAILAVVFVIRTRLPIHPKYEKVGITEESLWRVSFGQEVKILTPPRMVPEINGVWYEERGLFGVFALEFHPSEAYDRGATYTADVSVARVFKKDQTELPSIEFIASPAPGVVSLVFDDGSESISPRPTIVFTVDKQLAGKDFTPSLQNHDSTFTLISKTDTTYAWQPKSEFPQGIPLNLQIKNADNVLVVERHFMTVPEPKISSFAAKEPLLPGAVIHVEFNIPMPLDSSPLAFDMPGKGGWIDAKTYEFTVGSVTGGKVYTARLLSGSTSKDGGKVMVEDSRPLKSPGPAIGTFTTAKYERGVSDAIEMTFDQPTDHKSAEQAFRLTPAGAGSFSWSGNTMTFTPTKLAYQSSYTASLLPGVRGTYGLPSVSRPTFSFKTVPEAFKLNVPYFDQQYPKSCEAASLRMALAFFGVKTDDMSILQKLGYDPKPKDTVKNEWDDPRVMFVGDVTSAAEGYGVYGPPIARAAKAFGRTATFTTTITPQFLAKEVKAGHPVVLWGYTSLTAAPYTWHIPGDGNVTAFKGEHARLVVGVYGTAANPIGFFVHDPINGKKFEYWETSTLMAQVKAVPGVTNQAVVVK